MSNTLEAVRNSFQAQALSVGRQVLGEIYEDLRDPRFLSLELVDSDFRTLEIFTFPIMPSQMTWSRNNIVNVKKSQGGVIAIDNETYIPESIQIAGTFGRAFKIVLNDKPFELLGVNISFQNRKLSASFNQNKPSFSSFVKNGFGCLQILHRLYQEQKSLDESGRPKYLIMYSGPHGRNFIVKINNLTITENDSQQNMIPAYTMDFGTLAEYDQSIFRDQRSISRQLGRQAIQRGLNNIANQVKQAIF